MTAAASPSTRRFAPWLLVIGGLLLVAVIAGAPRNVDGEPLDPGSTSASGTKALMELLETFGADVSTAAEGPTDQTDVALLFVDTLDEMHTDELDAWVRGGGTLVVADPFSSLAPEAEGTTGAFGAAPPLDAQDCDIEVLGDVATVDPGAAVRYRVDESVRSCFGDGDTAYVVERSLGTGRVVAFGGTDLFTNARLGEADNAVAAARFLVPAPGTRVAVLQPGSGEGSSDRSLADVLNRGVRLGLLQLLVAFAVYAWYRARRLGRPVLEPQPVEIAGSELVLAVGQLLQQSKRPQHAADLLRADTRRRLGERLGLAPDVPDHVLADVVVGRTDIDADLVRRTLTDGPVVDDATLLALAQDLDTVRQEVLHGR